MSLKSHIQAIQCPTQVQLGNFLLLITVSDSEEKGKNYTIKTTVQLTQRFKKNFYSVSHASYTMACFLQSVNFINFFLL